MIEIAPNLLIAPALPKKAEKCPYPAPEGYVWKKPKAKDVIPVGTIFIPGVHERVHGRWYNNWVEQMREYVGKETRIIENTGRDSFENETVKIESDGGFYKFNPCRGWVLTKDGNHISDAPVDFSRPKAPVIGVAPDSMAGRNELGLWEFLQDPVTGIAVRLSPYTVFPVTKPSEIPGDNNFVDYDHCHADYINCIGAYGRVVNTHYFDQTSYPAQTRVGYDNAGRRIIQIELQDGKVVDWRLESTLTLVGHNDPTARVRLENDQLKAELSSVKNELAISKDITITHDAKIQYLEAELSRAQGRIDPAMRDLYLSVQRLLTRYFLVGELSTSDSGDAAMFDNLVDRYRAARKAAQATRGGKAK
jgi:hypothetical protein